ncbi:alpha/beta hydrolase [Crossiella sp. CA-258035]|uniref:alpha/beta hydrolase n=1 Tax=Crossiella sp. CA-258035 TaxID=2981138 RepID=UPI0024BCE223|nr:alpha/beta hydrolase [Crossiella sp. CA-258035]WHT21561.1 alpha/beta hydrolase [Crossiella sp. CA-258035]
MDRRFPVIVLLALACVACATPQPVAAGGLAWGDCAPFAGDAERRAAFDRRSLDCAALAVPLDHDKPDGRKLKIGLLRQRATDPARRIGSLVFNFGGPGASGMAEVAELGGRLAKRDAEVAARFDLVGFDPRGVGASEPALRCLTGPEQDARRAEPVDSSTPEGVAEQEARNKELADRCAERTGRDELAHLGTRDVVRDLDLLRAALGEEKLTYVGYSYGTKIGTGYAETFPARVRALVLDGADDFGLTGKHAEQGDGFAESFLSYAKDCAGRAACPVGDDPAGARQRLDALIEPLGKRPLPVGDRKLSAEDVSDAVDHLLYHSESWPRLTEAIEGLKAGDGTEMLAVADEYHGRRADGSYDGNQNALTAVNCMDAPPVKDRSKVEVLDVCAFWAAPNTMEPHRPKADGAPTAVVVSTTGDPATPHDWGIALAEALKARLVTFEGDQHTVYLEGKTCVDRPVTRYLVDGTLPPEGLRCK